MDIRSVDAIRSRHQVFMLEHFKSFRVHLCNFCAASQCDLSLSDSWDINTPSHFNSEPMPSTIFYMILLHILLGYSLLFSERSPGTGLSIIQNQPPCQERAENQPCTHATMQRFNRFLIETELEGKLSSLISLLVAESSPKSSSFGRQMRLKVTTQDS